MIIQQLSTDWQLIGDKEVGLCTVTWSFKNKKNKKNFEKFWSSIINMLRWLEVW